MLLVQALAAAILVHEALYVCRDGRAYLDQCFLPTFGLELRPRAHAAAHLALALGCALLLVWPDGAALQLFTFAMLSLVIASYSLRLSNHLVLAWFWLLLSCLSHWTSEAADRAAVLGAGVRWLVLGTYFFAGFHKFNHEYLSLEQSCASQMARFFCWDRRVRNPRLQHGMAWLGIYGTLVSELAIPLLLLSVSTRPLGVLFGALFHFALALLGIVNFSAVMYAGLLAFQPAGSVSELLEAARSFAGTGALIGAAVACCAVVLVFTPRFANRHCPYRHRAAAWPIQLGFGVATAVLLLVAGSAVLRPWPETVRFAALRPGEQVMILVPWLAFLLNGLGPYLGIKTEFSFAMFSNLRRDPWRHLLIPATLRPFDAARYVSIERISGVPAPEQITGDASARLAAHILADPGSYRYSRYFLYAALRRLRAAGAAELQVEYVDAGRRCALDAAALARARPFRDYLPLNLFPFVMPLDHGAAHSEQGGIVDRQRERQLF